jgi:hypothetical protein
LACSQAKRARPQNIVYIQGIMEISLRHQLQILAASQRILQAQNVTATRL